MEEIKLLSNRNNTIQIANALHKMYSLMKENRSETKNDSVEVDFLKANCKSENSQISLLSCQTFVLLVQDGVLEPAKVLSMFISMLPDSNLNQYTAISEGIISLLLLDLKNKTRNLKPNEEYKCPFGLRPPQHPLIMLIQSNDINMNDLAQKLNGICNHQDKYISVNSFKFLRPVYLYILCNPHVLQDSRTIYSSLLMRHEKSKEALDIIYTFLSWSRVTSPTLCDFISKILVETIEYMQKIKNYKIVIDFTLYLASILPNIVHNGYDPRPCLNIIYRVLQDTFLIDKSFYNILLVLLSKIVHHISPIYFPELTKPLIYIIVSQNCGNFISLYMIVDGLIQWIANPSFLSTDSLIDAQYLIDFITTDKYKANINHNLTQMYKNDIKSFNYEIAIAQDICLIAEKWEADEKTIINTNIFISNICKLSQINFCHDNHLMLRALFLSNELCKTEWINIFNKLLDIAQIDKIIALELLTPILYKLAKDYDPYHQLELLRGLTTLAVAKENVPLILNTIKAVSSSSLMKTFAMDLYLRLWKTEPRTYPFLYKTLLATPNSNQCLWEFQIAKSMTIKQICLLKPTQHGADLVIPLSDILNHCVDLTDGDIATSVALDAISALCENHAVNAVSTWKALSFKFRYEKRIKVIRSLCNFFAQIPFLRSPTPDYDKLLVEILEKLWNYVVLSDEAEVIKAALNALKSFTPELMTLKQLPDIFRQHLKLPGVYKKTPTEIKDPLEILTYIPGECWLQLIENVNRSAIQDAADLVSHYIHKEIEEYRGGIYYIPDGQPEPPQINAIPHKSPLRAITNYLIIQSRNKNSDSKLEIIENCLRSISKKFPKPIPPLDWCFLHEYFHSIECRKYCIYIAANQLMYSGTAKRLLENYINDFDPSQHESDDILVLLDILPQLANGNISIILRPFLKRLMVYSYNLYQDEKSTLFEQTLSAIKNTAEIKDLPDDSIEIFSTLLEEYLDILNTKDKIFQIYLDTLRSLPPADIDGFTTPTTWKEINITKLQKCTVIRCYLAENGTTTDNPLDWLNPIVDSIAEIPSEHTFLLRKLAKLFQNYKDVKTSSSWAMELLGQIQTILADKTLQKKNQCLFLCDVFLVCVIMQSGIGNLINDIVSLAISREIRLQVFPESLYAITKQNYWIEIEVKIYEFLYHMCQLPEIAKHFKNSFKSALICSKNRSYFDQKNLWTKYVSL